MNVSQNFIFIADRLLLLPAVFMLVLVGMLVIVSESVFWFDDELVLLPLFVIVGLVVIAEDIIEMAVTVLVLMEKVKVVMINLLLLVMVDEMVVLRPPYVPF